MLPSSEADVFCDGFTRRLRTKCTQPRSGTAYNRLIIYTCMSRRCTSKDVVVHRPSADLKHRDRISVFWFQLIRSIACTYTRRLWRFWLPWVTGASILLTNASLTLKYYLIATSCLTYRLSGVLSQLWYQIRVSPSQWFVFVFQVWSLFESPECWITNSIYIVVLHSYLTDRRISAMGSLTDVQSCDASPTMKNQRLGTTYV